MKLAVTLVCTLAPLVAACSDDGNSGDDVSGVDGGDGPIGATCELPPLAGGVSTLTGCDEPGAADGPRGVARLANPVNVIGGPDGQVYVADFDNGLVRVVAPDGETTTLVEQEGFSKPFGLAFGADGTLFVQTDRNDAGEQSPMTGTIWRVDTTTGVAEVVARDVGRPRGLAMLPDGRLVLSDYVHHTVRLLDPDTGSISNLAGVFDQPGDVDGTAAQARFDKPYGVAVLPDGRIVVADYGNDQLRAVTTSGQVTTFAGTGAEGNADGPAASATFAAPQGVSVDGAGNLYVSDTDSFSIRRISADGQVTTVAGAGAGWRDGSLGDAQFYGLEGLDVSADGSTLWVADGSRGEAAPHHFVRVVDLP